VVYFLASAYIDVYSHRTYVFKKSLI